MAIVEIPVEDLLEEIRKISGKRFNEKEGLELLKQIGIDVEIEEEEEEKKYVIDVFPNRPDYLIKAGIVRDLAFFLGGGKIRNKNKLHSKDKYKVEKSGYKLFVEKSVKDVRPYTVCAVVEGLSLDDKAIREIISLQEKLHMTLCRDRKKGAIGIYPLKEIKWPIRYLALEPEKIRFVPLGEYKEMSGKEILEKHETGKKYAHLLEGYKKYPIFIDANNNILSMPPIINSETTGKVTIETKDVFIEVSGHDIDFLNSVLSIIVTALVDMGGKIKAVEMNYPYKALHNKTRFISPLLDYKKIRLNKENIKKINQLVGVELSLKDIKKLLEKRGFYISASNVLEVPPYRMDIKNIADLAEEVAISYGYENLPSKEIKYEGEGKESKEWLFFDTIKELCIGMGLVEIKGYSLCSEWEINLYENKAENAIKITNAKSSKYSYLRSHLLPSIMVAFRRSANEPYPQRIFEIGEVFIKEKKERNKYEIKEIMKLSIGIAGSGENFSRIKSYVEAVFKVLGIKKLRFEMYNDKRFIEGRCAIIKKDNNVLGVLGEVHPEIIENYDLEVPISYCEIDIDKIKEILMG